jgi:hypothetical protein
MNERQRLAYSNPCARARDTLAREFFRDVTAEGARLSTALTVNK